ncbi:MAG: Crp/Fnr family transcriptional regulator [Ardenticatenaceae bacterium]|nr:Crp/Fnr family transcriptional regulator [Ardenticatenaceae bacterium]
MAASCYDTAVMNTPLPAEIEQTILAKCQLFQNLDTAALTYVINAAARRQYNAGSFVFYQEDEANTFYVLLQGSVRMTQITPEGQQVIVHFFGPGQGVGIIAALGQFAYPLTAETVEDCLFLVWDSELMNQLMEKYPRLAMNAARMLAIRFNELQDRYRELATERVERRIARTLLRLAKQLGKKSADGILINMPLSRRDLAEMTGTTLFTVSRTISKWEQDRLVKTAREQVIICSPHGLVKIAEDLPEKP